MKEKVEGHQNLYKDSNSGVILNRADTERQRYNTAKKHALDNIKTKEDLEKLKGELDNIKHILKQLQR